MCHCCTGSNTVRALFSKPLPPHLQCARLFLRSIFAVTMVISFLSRFASLQILLLMSGQEWYMSAMLHENVRQKLFQRIEYIRNHLVAFCALLWYGVNLLVITHQEPYSTRLGVTYQNNFNLYRKIQLG